MHDLQILREVKVFWCTKLKKIGLGEISSFFSRDRKDGMHNLFLL